MEGMATPNPAMEFDLPQNGGIDPLISIQSQECDLTQAMPVEPPGLVSSVDCLLSVPPEEGAVQGEGGHLIVDNADVPLQTPVALLALVPSGQSLEPVLGMEFDSPYAARAFYSAYADHIGFQIRNSKSFTSRVDDTVIMRRFVCSKQGRPSKKNPLDFTKKRRNRTSSREGCKAMLQVNRRENGMWTVSRCVLDHCHPLGIAPKSSSAQNKLTKKPWELLASSAAETQQSGLGPGGGVAQSLLEYFKKMQAENPAFFYAIQVDLNNCLSNVFWADARGRMAYSYFGDVVVLDMTCKKNKYAVPLAAFTGMNHHRQFVVFGCAFMTDESEASFIWLFETWLRLMNERQPVSFVTAYNEAIAFAAAKVFPDVQHHFCSRDIFSKCNDKLPGIYSSQSIFKAEFKKCIYNSEIIEEFDSNWRSLIDRYSLGDNMWLQLLYGMRQKWVPLFLRRTFLGEFSGAPKLETMHKFFQRHSITTTTLRDLVTQFNKAMAGHYDKELQADFLTINTWPVLKTPSPMEKQASEIYTKTIFDLFQLEFVESAGFLVEKIEDGIANIYRVTKVDDASKTFMVMYNSSQKAVSCTCYKFEYSGILCRHVLRCLLVIGILTIPEDYILRRWTRNARNTTLPNDNLSGFHSGCQKILNWRCSDLCQDAFRLAEEGATSAVIYKVAKGALQKAFSEVLATKAGSFFN